MESDSLTMLMNRFCERLDGIRFMIDLKENRRNEDEEDCQEHIEHLSEETDKLFRTLTDIKSALKHRQQKVEEMKV